MQPWYETYKATFNITNLTKYPLELYILPIVCDKNKLVAGYAKLMHDNFMIVDPHGIDQIKVSGILGLTDNFVRIFAMVINDSANCYFRLRGQGILPILSVTTPLPKLEQSLNDILEEYEYLRIIYNYEIFKSITEWDKDGHGDLEEDGLDQETLWTPDFSVLSESDEDMPSERQQIHDKQFFLMIHTYVQVFNNQELPLRHPRERLQVICGSPKNPGIAEEVQRESLHRAAPALRAPRLRPQPGSPLT